MSKRDRRDDGRDRDRRDGDRRDRDRDRDRDWDDEGQQRRSGEGDVQESESLTALKAILSKVAALLKPMNLSAEESIRLVEQLYGSVLDMDSALAGEADDTRKSSTLAYIQNTNIRRDGDKIAVDFPTAEELRAAQAPPAQAAAAPAAAPAQAAPRAEAPARPADKPAAPDEKPAEAAAAPPRPPRGRPRQPRQEQSQDAPTAPTQQTLVDPAERGVAPQPEPEGPEA